jgi:hypothetical protein
MMDEETQVEQDVTIYSTLWFIGLEFKITNNELVDLNLTDTIQGFTDMSKFFFLYILFYFNHLKFKLNLFSSLQASY